MKNLNRRQAEASPETDAVSTAAVGNCDRFSDEILDTCRERDCWKFYSSCAKGSALSVIHIVQKKIAALQNKVHSNF